MYKNPVTILQKELLPKKTISTPVRVSDPKKWPPEPPKSKPSKKKIQQQKEAAKKTPQKQVKKEEEEEEIKMDEEKKEEKPEQQQMQIKTRNSSSSIQKKTELNKGELRRPQYGIIDVVFCCDTTGSMGSYLAQAKNTIKTICDNIIKKVGYEGIDVKFGFVCYQDHKPQMSNYVTEVQDLCYQDEMFKFLDKQVVYGGGDGPEAVLDGLWDSVEKIKWREYNDVPTLKYIFHIADAPPHGKDLYGGHSTEWNKGCPCKLTAEQIGKKMNEKQIHYRLINCNEYSLKQMSEVFKKNFFNFEQYPLKDAKDLNVRVCDMIVKEAYPEELR